MALTIVSQFAVRKQAPHTLPSRLSPPLWEQPILLIVPKVFTVLERPLKAPN